MTPDSDTNARALSAPRRVAHAHAFSIQRLRKPDAPEKFELFPIQREALATFVATKGRLVCWIGVGHGKTLIACLVASISHYFLKRKSILLLIPSDSRVQYSQMLAEYRRYFHIPPPEILRLRTYDELSRDYDAKTHTGLFERLRPDHIIADEAHTFGRMDSARTRRFMRYATQHKPLFTPLTGTFTDKSIGQYAHLFALALGEGSPVPANGPILEAWENAIAPMGRPNATHFARVKPLVERFGNPRGWDTLAGVAKSARARDALRNRLQDTQGIVFTTASSVPVPLALRCVTYTPPQAILDALAIVEDQGMRPDLADFVDSDATRARIRREISAGFYYRWAWETVGGRNEPWIVARSELAAWIRREIQLRGQLGYDSPGLILQAAASPEKARVKPPGGLVLAYREWLKVADQMIPPTVPVWVDESLVDRALALARETSYPVILWYESLAIEALLARRKIPVFGRGTEPPTEPPRVCGMSIAVHGQSKNLQRWCRAIVLEPPANGKTWEQMLGRLHRAGQSNPAVFLVMQHTKPFRECLDKATTQAQYVHDSMQPQKLLYARRS